RMRVNSPGANTATRLPKSEWLSSAPILMKSAAPRSRDGEVLVWSMIMSHGGASVLAVEPIREYLSVGVMQAPHQTLAVQVLRNTRRVEEIAHGSSFPIGPSRSPNPTQYAASGRECARLRTSRRSGPASCAFDQQ